MNLVDVSSFTSHFVPFKCQSARFTHCADKGFRRKAAFQFYNRSILHSCFFGANLDESNEGKIAKPPN